MFYGVAGSNGFAVYNNRERALRARSWLDNFECLQSDKMDTAFNFARDEYNEYRMAYTGDYDEYCNINSSQAILNHIYFKKEIIQMNK